MAIHDLATAVKYRKRKGTSTLGSRLLRPLARARLLFDGRALLLEHVGGGRLLLDAVLHALVQVG